MKRKVDRVLNSGVLSLVALLLWSVWAAAQTNPPAPATNAVRSTAAGASLNGERSGRDRARAERVSLTFYLDQVSVLNTATAFGEPLWKYIASLLYIFLAFYLSKFLDYLTRVWLKKWTAKTKSQLDDLLLGLLNGPIKIISFVIFLNIGLGVFDWP